MLDPLPDFLAPSRLNPSINILDDASEMFFVNLFLSDNLLNYIKDSVNNRAWEEVEAYLDENENLVNWCNVTLEEMKKFIGIIFYTGIMKKPKLYNYWTQDPLYPCDLFTRPECLSQLRFCEILKYFRVCDYSQRDQLDPIGRIRPFIDLCNDICKKCYMLEK